MRQRVYGLRRTACGCCGSSVLNAKSLNCEPKWGAKMHGLRRRLADVILWLMELGRRIVRRLVP
jgi:hypothetical protein